MFADLFSGKGRRSVPPSVVAGVMVLQRLEGLSDREAVDRFTFDVRWRYAAGVGGWDGQGRIAFAHTVLVDMRERLRRSDRPDRIFALSRRRDRSYPPAAVKLAAVAVHWQHSAPPESGRIITIGHHETRLTAARVEQTDPDWVADYRAARPKVERKIAHLMRRRHGGRKARMRGIPKISADFKLLAAAVNLARLAILAA